MWKREVKCRPFLQFALRPRFSAVRLNDMFDNCQPQSRAATFARPRAIHPVEPLEDTVDGIRGDSRPIIRHKNLRVFPISIYFARAHFYVAFGFAVLDGVVPKVEQNLLETVGISPNDGPRRDLVFERHFPRGGWGRQIFQHPLRQIVEIELFHIQRNLAGFQFGNGQQVFD